jgi:hypothetical protein
MRVAGAGYGTNTFDTALGTQGGSRIDFRATENYTNTAKGSDIHFWTTQPGTTSTVNSGSIDWQGFTGNAFTFTTDNTVQTTAGIPLTQKGSGLGVATLDTNGFLTAAQIPPSLLGGVVYQGSWNANTNTPTLVNGTGTTGFEYSIGTTGTQNLGGGSQVYQQGGFVIYNGTTWSYVPPSGLFTSLTAGTHLSVSTPTGAITVTVDATPNSTASTIVSRDASGNFAANTITATLSGAATSAGTVTTAAQPNITSVGTLSSLNVTANITAGNVTASSGTVTAATGQFTNINNSLAGANAAIATANTAMKSYVDGQITTVNTTAQTLNANVGAFEIFSNANTAGLYNSILGANAAIVTSNSAVVSYVNTLNTAMASNVAGANTAIVTANTAMKSYVDAVSTAWTANAATQQGQIAILQTQVYANANVTAYLTTATINTTGNITAGNVTVNTRTYSPKQIFSGTGTRTVTGGTALTVDFSVDEIVLWSVPTGNGAITLANYTAGSRVKVIIRLTTARNFTLGVAAVQNTTTGGQGGTTITGTGGGAMYGANQAVILDYTCVDGTSTNTYVQVAYI